MENRIKIRRQSRRTYSQEWAALPIHHQPWRAAPKVSMQGTETMFMNWVVQMTERTLEKTALNATIKKSSRKDCQSPVPCVESSKLPLPVTFPQRNALTPRFRSFYLAGNSPTLPLATFRQPKTTTRDWLTRLTRRTSLLIDNISTDAAGPETSHRGWETPGETLSPGDLWHSNDHPQQVLPRIRAGTERLR